MLTLASFCAIAAFAGLAVVGHVAALQTIFTSADHADRRREKYMRRSFLPDVPV